MASFNFTEVRTLRRLTLALGVLALGGSGFPWIRAEAADRRFRLEPREAVVDEPVWLCLERGTAPPAVHVDGSESSLPGAAAGGGGAPLHAILVWPEVGPIDVLAGVQPAADLPAHSGGAISLPPGEYVFSADGFEPETLRVREGSSAERRDYALLRRVRWHREAGDSAYAARLLEDFLVQSRNPSAILWAKLELLSVLPFTEYADHRKLWLSEWVARHHPNCVVGIGIQRWLAVVSAQEGIETLQEIASSYAGTRAAAVASELLRASSVRANENPTAAGKH